MDLSCVEDPDTCHTTCEQDKKKEGSGSEYDFRFVVLNGPDGVLVPLERCHSLAALPIPYLDCVIACTRHLQRRSVSVQGLLGQRNIQFCRDQTAGRTRPVDGLNRCGDTAPYGGPTMQGSLQSAEVTARLTIILPV